MTKCDAGGRAASCPSNGLQPSTGDPSLLGRSFVNRWQCARAGRAACAPQRVHQGLHNQVIAARYATHESPLDFRLSITAWSDAHNASADRELAEKHGMDPSLLKLVSKGEHRRRLFLPPHSRGGQTELCIAAELCIYRGTGYMFTCMLPVLLQTPAASA